MHGQNQKKSQTNKSYIHKKEKKQRADAILKRALAECMQEEADQVRKKTEVEGQHAFSRSFIEKMQFVLKQGKAAEEQQIKQVRRRQWTHVAAVCIACVAVAGGSWIGLHGNLRQSQNEMSASGAKTGQESANETLELGKTGQVDAGDERQNLSDAQRDETVISNQDKGNAESSQESISPEEESSASGENIAQKIEVKVLAATPTSLKVRLTNIGDEDISFGDAYSGIEVYDASADEWRECQKQAEIVYHDIRYTVKAKDKSNWYDWSVDWSSVYGALEAGHYRLQKDISTGTIAGGDQYVQQIQIEFDIR